MINWYLVGFAMAVGTFWGVFATLFYVDHPLLWKGPWNAFRSAYILVFQFFFQFIGGFAGCMGLGLFYDRYSHGHLGWLELVILGASLVGVSGKLSDMIYKLPGMMDPKFKEFIELLKQALIKYIGKAK
jgi:hypothetical protein